MGDLSAAVTGILLGLTLPPGVPVYVPIVGSAFAIVIAKQLFGGLGTNFVNPALAARAFVLAAWPLHLTSAWINPLTHDAATGATPLAAFGAGHSAVSLPQLLIGNRLGSLGETSAIAILLGAAYLLYRKVIDLRIPAGYIVTLGLGIFIFGKPGALFQGEPLTGVLLGGVLLGAFFMATDYVSTGDLRGRLYMESAQGLLPCLSGTGASTLRASPTLSVHELGDSLIDRFVQLLRI